MHGKGTVTPVAPNRRGAKGATVAAQSVGLSRFPDPNRAGSAASAAPLASWPSGSAASSEAHVLPAAAALVRRRDQGVLAVGAHESMAIVLSFASARTPPFARKRRRRRRPLAPENDLVVRRDHGYAAPRTRP
jgi:hypothetical protein